MNSNPATETSSLILFAIFEWNIVDFSLRDLHATHDELKLYKHSMAITSFDRQNMEWVAYFEKKPQVINAHRKIS